MAVCPTGSADSSRRPFERERRVTEPSVCMWLLWGRGAAFLCLLRDSLEYLACLSALVGVPGSLQSCRDNPACSAAAAACRSSADWGGAESDKADAVPTLIERAVWPLQVCCSLDCSGAECERVRRCHDCSALLFDATGLCGWRTVFFPSLADASILCAEHVGTSLISESPPGRVWPDFLSFGTWVAPEAGTESMSWVWLAASLQHLPSCLGTAALTK